MQKLKAFHYLLDETITPNESFTPSPSTDRILIGKRTGFAFYRDHKLNRKILIGVFEGNSRVNNYYDGPFDQLPDNFLDGNSLRDAILDVAPNLKGRIDRYGGSFDGETRYMIAPYTHYSVEDDLLMFHRCATSKDVPADQYHLCFVYDDSEDDPQNAPAPSSQPAPPATKAPPGEKGEHEEIASPLPRLPDFALEFGVSVERLPRKRRTLSHDGMGGFTMSVLRFAAVAAAVVALGFAAFNAPPKAQAQDKAKEPRKSRPRKRPSGRRSRSPRSTARMASTSSATATIRRCSSSPRKA